MDFIIAPSSGKIILISEYKGYTQISTFLGLRDDHKQYVPLDGECDAVIYKPGRFHIAYILQKSNYNERSTTIFNTTIGQITVVQIAGLIARRIINNAVIGNGYKQGEIYGEILLGSRVDILFPSGKINVMVANGDRLTGGLTNIASIK